LYLPPCGKENEKGCASEKESFRHFVRLLPPERAVTAVYLPIAELHFPTAKASFPDLLSP
jgi:hypothetical protein